LFEQPLQAFGVLGDGRVHLGVRAFEICIGDHAWTTVARATHVHRIQVTLHDGAIQVHVHEIEARRGAPMAKQPGLDVFALQRLAEQRVVIEIYLADGQVIGRAPVGVHPVQQAAFAIAALAGIEFGFAICSGPPGIRSSGASAGLAPRGFHSRFFHNECFFPRVRPGPLRRARSAKML